LGFGIVSAEKAGLFPLAFVARLAKFSWITRTGAKAKFLIISQELEITLKIIR